MPATATPIAVAVTRGDLVESRHLCWAAVARPDGALEAAWGEVERPVYARSAVKPLQALPLVRSGAAERYGLSDAELALACGSHSGEPAHVATVARWLERLGLGAAELRCGAHPPLHEPSAHALIREGRSPSALHNNCSGKHAGILSHARLHGEPVADYLSWEHPAQQRVAAALAAMTGVALGAPPRGIDGCGIPVLGLPLAAIATAMARLARPEAAPAEWRGPARRIAAAMAAAPEMVGGTGRVDTEIVQATGGRVLTKVGAEGVQAAILPEAGLGVALKVADGAARAAPVALAPVLRHAGALSAEEARALSRHLVPRRHNHAGTEVGAIRAALPPLE